MKKSILALILSIFLIIALGSACSPTLQSVSIQSKNDNVLEVSAGTSINGLKSLLECKINYNNGTSATLSSDDFDLIFDKEYKSYVVQDTQYAIKAQYNGLESNSITFVLKADSNAKIQLSITNNIIDSYTEIDDFYDMFSVKIKYSNNEYESVPFNSAHFNCTPSFDSYTGDRTVYNVSYTYANITSAPISVIRSATNPGYTDIVAEKKAYHLPSTYSKSDIQNQFVLKLKDGDNRLYTKDVSEFNFVWKRVKNSNEVDGVFTQYHYDKVNYHVYVSHIDHRDLQPIQLEVTTYPVTSQRILEWEGEEIKTNIFNVARVSNNVPDEDIYKKYACILSDVPLDVYTSPVVSAQNNPNHLKYSGDESVYTLWSENKNKVDNIAEYLKKLMLDANTRGYNISFTYYSSLTYQNGAMTVLRVKCKINSPVGTYADVFDFQHKSNPNINMLFDNLDSTAVGGEYVWLDITVAPNYLF